MVHRFVAPAARAAAAKLATLCAFRSFFEKYARDVMLAMFGIVRLAIIAITEITTSSSTKLNAWRGLRFCLCSATFTSNNNNRLRRNVKSKTHSHSELRPDRIRARLLTMPTAMVTCGPAFEPIDSVRRITNLSTGELGTTLCETLTDAGFTVTCLRSETATHPAPSRTELHAFSTNTSLREILESLPPPDVLFHTAALCDFVVAEKSATGGKIRSDLPELHLTLRPAEKVLPLLRPLFPDTILVGWKYEVDGTPQSAVERGRHQIVTNRTDACVVNGPAYGDGLGLVEATAITHFSTRRDLCQHLGIWTQKRLTEAAAPPITQSQAPPSILS